MNDDIEMLPPSFKLCAFAISVCSNGSSLCHDAPLYNTGLVRHPTFFTQSNKTVLHKLRCTHNSNVKAVLKIML